MRPLALLLAALAGAVVPVGAVSAVQTQTPDGQLGVRLLEAPENRRDDPRARIYIVDHLNQGGSIERRFEISNTTAEIAEVALYAAAATVEDGQFRFGEGRARSDLTDWTTITPVSVRVPPGGTMPAKIAVTVPSDAVDGERYAVVWAEQASTGGGNVGQVSRVGIRMYISVGEGAEPASDFVVDELVARRDAQGAPTVSARVTNTGERALDMSGTLQLTDGPGGLSAGPFNATVGTTLGIGQSQPVDTVLDPALPAGPWRVKLALRSGELERVVEATITFPDQGEAAPVDAELVEDAGPPWLWIALGAGLLLALALLLLFLLKRRNRRDDDEKKTSVLVAPPA